MQCIDKKEYRNIHSWLQRHYGKATKCVNPQCDGKSVLYNWALKKGKEYFRDRNNFIQLCCSCHVKYDYTEERKRKQRRFGEKNHQCKLNERQVRVIRHLRNIKPRMTQVAIANIFNISQIQISRICRGEKWKHIPLNYE